MAGAYRLNVTLDEEHATKLARLADRTYMQEGTLARSLLSKAIDEADLDGETATRLLDGIDGAYESALLGREQARRGETVPLDQI